MEKFEKIVEEFIKKDGLYEVVANDVEMQIYHQDVCDFGVIVTENEVSSVKITGDFVKSGVIRPLSKGFKFEIVDGALNLEMKIGDIISIEPNGSKPLFLRCSKPIAKPENITHLFESGKIYDVGHLELKENDVVYLEEGSIVSAAFYADTANNVKILGHGVSLSTMRKPAPTNGGGGLYKGMVPIGPMVLAVDCKNLLIQGVNFIDSPQWNIVPTNCDDVVIDDILIVSTIMSGDGVDIVGSRNVELKNSMVYVNDDCVALKSVRYHDERGAREIRNVSVKDCVLWNSKCGNAIEIGFETSAKEICDVVFEDIDVIHCQKEGWQSGGVFTIHNGDRARVHHITYKNIRVENAMEKLVDFKILSSKYSSDLSRGTIDNILFENVSIIDGPFPPSIIRGVDGDAGELFMVEKVTFKNLTVHGEKITNQLDARLIAEISSDITFE